MKVINKNTFAYHIKRSQFHQSKASDLAVKMVEKYARNILKHHKNLNEFVMCMGTFFFTDYNDNVIDTYTSRMNASYDYYYINSREYFKPLNDFISKWDDELKITGASIRFTATSEITTNW